MLKLSDALPIKFYLNGVETFNQKSDNYIDKFCFNEQFKCGTDVRLRVSDAKVRVLQLRGYDADNNQVLSLPFVRTQINTNLVDEKFTADLDGWAGGGYGITHKSETWSWIGGLAVSDVSQVGSTIKHTQVLSKAFALAIGQHYLNIYYELGDSSTDQQIVTLQLFLINSGAVVRTINVDLFEGQTSSYQRQIVNFPFQADIDYDSIGFGFIYSANSLTIDTRIGRVQVGDMIGNYYDVNFVGSDYGLCDSQTRFQIENKYTFNPLTQFEQLSSGGGTDPVNLQTTPIRVSLGALGGGHDTAIVKSSSLEFIAGDYSFDYDLNTTQAGAQLTLDFYKNGILVGTGTSLTGVSGDVSSHIDVTLTDVPDLVKLTIANTAGLATVIKLTSLESASPPFGMAAQSDPVEITSAVGTLLTIKYKSSKNFAGLIWNENDQYMQIDIDARFFRTRPKDTVKAIDLSNSKVIGTASELKEQKALQTYAMPPYMHRKIELALMHSVNGNVSIDEEDVTMEEAYTLTALGEWNPFSTGEIWLTNKTFNERNVI